MLDRTALLERTALAWARMGLVAPPLPLPFFDAYLAPVAARAITAAGALGVFDALDDRPDDAAGLAARTGLDPARLEPLLAALVTLGYVRRRRGRYRLSRFARRWVGRDGGQRAWVGRFARRSYEGMLALEDVLQGGEPLGLHDRPAGDPFWGDYQAAMAENAGLAAEAVAGALPLDDARRLLDLAGGPGLFAAAAVRRAPGLEATVVELPGAVRAAAPQTGVTFLEGDLFEVELGTGFDVVTAHSILHNLDAEACVALMRRALDALRPGGTFAALELELPAEGRPGSQIATLGSLVFLVYAGTRAWRASELEAFARRAGFTGVRLTRPAALNGSVVLLARRPA